MHLLSRIPFLLALSLASTIPGRADLTGYLAKEDASFAWELRSKTDAPGATFYDLRLTSQTWQGIVWRHNLQLFVPLTPFPKGAGVLVIEGGSQTRLEQKASFDAVLYGSLLAQKVGLPCAILRQVPNQPLLGGLREDALIAETFRRYLDTHDASWPLLFPMTKAAVRAMDALGEFSARDLGGRLEKFVVTGGSKRGWTTWLAAASDPRVVALAPMVIDMLNSKPQMEHQEKVFGKWSEATGDYHALMRRGESTEMQALWGLVDPYSFREKLTQPKLIILGNNDPYWATDALNLYWEGLSGPKWIHYVPNAGHSLTQKSAGGKNLLPLGAIDTLAVFARHQLGAATLPQLAWKHDEKAGRPHLEVQASPAPKLARLWVAHAPTPDFRTAKWEEQPVSMEGDKISGGIDVPATGSAAFYAALEYESDGLTYQLCTQLRIVDAPARALP